MGLSLKGITDFLGNRADNIVNNAQGLERQVNPFDGGQTFGSNTTPLRPAPVQQPSTIPSNTQDVPSFNNLGFLSNQKPNTSVWQQNGLTLYDPTEGGVVGTNNPDHFLALMPHFPQYQAPQPKPYISGTDQINRILGRL